MSSEEKENLITWFKTNLKDADNYNYMKKLVKISPLQNFSYWKKKKNHIDRILGFKNSDDTPFQFEDFVTLLRIQDRRCLICGPNSAFLEFLKEKGRGGYLGPVIDHDHKTGQVRGLLCAPCNLMLGHAGDDESKLSRALLYLKTEGNRTKAFITQNTDEIPTPLAPEEYVDIPPIHFDNANIFLHA